MNRTQKSAACPEVLREVRQARLCERENGCEMRRGNTTDNETMKIMEEDVHIDENASEMRRDDITR